MDKREQLARKVVAQAVNMIVGGYENSVLDGHIEKMPSRDHLVTEIYREAINTSHVEVGPYLVAVKKDIRFITKDKMVELIEKRLSKEGY